MAAYRTDAFVRINASPITGTSAHAGGLVMYVDKANAAAYAPGSKGPFPAGTTLVKVSEPDDKIFAIMKKLKAGSDPAAGDWWYWERYGGNVIDPGRGGGFCAECHMSRGKETDSVLGLDVFVRK